MSDINKVDVHNIEPSLKELYEERFKLKDRLADVEKHIDGYQSEKINALRQVEGLIKYVGESRDYKISYNPAREYFSWTIKADPEGLALYIKTILTANYGSDKVDKFTNVIKIIVSSLLTSKYGYEKYEVRRHKAPKDLPELALDVNIDTEF